MSATRYHLVVIVNPKVTEFHGGPPVLSFDGESQDEMLSLIAQHVGMSIHMSLTKEDITKEDITPPPVRKVKRQTKAHKAALAEAKRSVGRG